MTRLIPLLLLLSACGPRPSFPGNYTGQVSALVTCGDPSIDSAGTFPTAWAVTQTGTNLSITVTGGTCNPIGATVEAQAVDQAEFPARTCPAVPDQFGGAVTLRLLDGTAVLGDAGELSFFIRTLSQFVDPGVADATCPGAVFGTLDKQK